MTAGLRLVRLYLLSRRVPAACCLLAALGCVLCSALHWRWNIAGGPAAQLAIPMIVETCAAAIVAVTSYGPFGDTERAASWRLPWLRLSIVLVLAAAAFGLLSAGASGGYLPGGVLALLRNLVGMTGIGLLSAAALGGAFGWVGPMGYLFIIEGALADGWTTPWVWASRPAGDVGGAVCATAVFAAGLAAIAALGARGAGHRVAAE